jgi:hypothetical protein
MTISIWGSGADSLHTLPQISQTKLKLWKVICDILGMSPLPASLQDRIEVGIVSPILLGL